MHNYNHTIKIKHDFISQAYDLVALFDDVYNMESFKKKITEQANSAPERYDRDKYLGDGFEFFTQLVIHLCGTDKRIGITNYEIIPPDDDIGIDAIGLNNFGKRCAIQIKFRSSLSYQLKLNEDHLGNMFLPVNMYNITDSENLGVDFRYFIFTTANGLYYTTETVMKKAGKSVKCFAWNDFKELLDDNNIFWDLCRKIVQEIEPEYKKREREEKISVRS